MRQIVITISFFLIYTGIQAQDCHTISIGEADIQLTSEVNGRYELGRVAIPTGDVGLATSELAEKVAERVSTQASIPIELVYVSDRDYGIAKDVFYHQRLNGDTLHHWYTRIRLNARDEVDYIYLNMAIETDSVQAHPLKVTRNTNSNIPNSTQVTWGVNLGVPKDGICSDPEPGVDIMTLASDYYISNDYGIIWEDEGYVIGRFANMLDGSQTSGSDYRIKYDGGHDCNTSSSIFVEEKEKYIAGNMVFYVNDFVYWAAERFINGALNELKEYLDLNFEQKILLEPILEDQIQYSIDGGIGDKWLIALGEFEGNNQPHQGHDPDYSLFTGATVMAEINMWRTGSLYDISMRDLLVRLYWESFTERHTNLPNNEPDRIMNAISPVNLSRRVKTFGGEQPDNHIVVPDENDLPEYDPTKPEEYIEFLNQLWYGIYDRYVDNETTNGKVGFYDLLELSWVDLSGFNDDHLNYLKKILYPNLLAQWESGIVDEDAFCDIRDYIDKLHPEYDSSDPTSVNYMEGLPSYDYYIKDAGAAHCPSLPESNPTSGDCVNNDRGIEPNWESGGFASESIWNCPPDDPTCGEHNNPVYKLESGIVQDNHMRITIHHNMSLCGWNNLDNYTLSIYGVVTTTSISWAAWGGEEATESTPDCNGVLIGRKLGEISLPNDCGLNPNCAYNDIDDTYTFTIPWKPFNPQDFSGCGTFTGPEVHMCVLAKIDADDDPFDVGDESWELVPKNNNAAARNMTVIWDQESELSSGSSNPAQYHLLNVMTTEDRDSIHHQTMKPVNLYFEFNELGPFQSADALLNQSDLLIKLSPSLQQAIQSSGALPSGSDAAGYEFTSESQDEIRVLSDSFRIEQLQIDPGTIYPAAISFETQNGLDSGMQLQFNLIQENEPGCIEGGVEYLVKSIADKPVPDSTSEVGLRFLESTQSTNVLVYPNPARDRVVIKSEDSAIENIRVFAYDGGEVFSQKTEKVSSFPINLTNWVPSIYVAEVRLTNGDVQMVRFVVSK